MSVWYCIPSKREPAQANEVLKLWRERGYRIILWRDPNDERWPIPEEQLLPLPDQYPGYAVATNHLVCFAMCNDPDAEWFVLGGDDIEPDPNHSAEEIAWECSVHFQSHWQTKLNEDPGDGPMGGRSDLVRFVRDRMGETFGVMQPTGDQWGDKNGPYIQRVCGSPWIGREFARRINQGRGPLWPEYFHMGSDEELQAVATKYGVLWQRSDLTHFHRHWGRPRQGEKMGMADRMPDFLKRANSPEEWRKYKKLFAERQAAGFPGSDPIA